MRDSEGGRTSVIRRAPGTHSCRSDLELLEASLRKCHEQNLLKKSFEAASLDADPAERFQGPNCQVISNFSGRLSFQSVITILILTHKEDCSLQLTPLRRTQEALQLNVYFNYSVPRYTVWTSGLSLTHTHNLLLDCLADVSYTLLIINSPSF